MSSAVHWTSETLQCQHNIRVPPLKYTHEKYPATEDYNSGSRPLTTIIALDTGLSCYIIKSHTWAEPSGTAICLSGSNCKPLSHKVSRASLVQSLINCKLWVQSLNATGFLVFLTWNWTTCAARSEWSSSPTWLGSPNKSGSRPLEWQWLPS